mmetsp:Transcript_16635/g.49759  ORF Transcript_16635/g.49759 Transcript_16635/m.49759 type:complete len:286 (-) Transcript_16635:512-1369(-)
MQVLRQPCAEAAPRHDGGVPEKRQAGQGASWSFRVRPQADSGGGEEVSGSAGIPDGGAGCVQPAAAAVSDDAVLASGAHRVAGPAAPRLPPALAVRVQENAGGGGAGLHQVGPMGCHPRRCVSPGLLPRARTPAECGSGARVQAHRGGGGDLAGGAGGGSVHVLRPGAPGQRQHRAGAPGAPVPPGCLPHRAARRHPGCRQGEASGGGSRHLAGFCADGGGGAGGGAATRHAAAAPAGQPQTVRRPAPRTGRFGARRTTSVAVQLQLQDAPPHPLPLPAVPPGCP